MISISFPKYFTRNNLRISGIYFLLNKGRIVYIGQSKNVFIRILLTSHDMRYYEYDSIRIIECPENKLLYYEKRLLILFRPKHNTMHLYKFTGKRKQNKVPINELSQRP